MNTYKVEVILRNGVETVVFVESGRSLDGIATGIVMDLQEFKAATIKHNAGVLIAVNPISVEVS